MARGGPPPDRHLALIRSRGHIPRGGYNRGLAAGANGGAELHEPVCDRQGVGKAAKRRSDGSTRQSEGRPRRPPYLGSGPLHAGPEQFGSECVDSDLDPILKFDPDGNVVESFGSGMFIWPHGINVDSERNVWVTDAVGDANSFASRERIPNHSGERSGVRRRRQRRQPFGGEPVPNPHRNARTLRKYVRVRP